MTPNQCLRACKRAYAELAKADAELSARIAACIELAKKAEDAVLEARESLMESLIDDDGSYDEEDQELIETLDDGPFPPEADALEDPLPDWRAGMARFKQQLDELEQAIRDRP